MDRRVHHPASMRRIPSFAILAALALGAPVALADTTPTAPVAAEHVSAPVPQPADGSDYAQREHRDAPATESFSGGSVVVVGLSSTALIVLLVALLVL